MRPSQPEVRHFDLPPERLRLSFLGLYGPVLGLAVRGMTTFRTPRSCRVIVDAGLAVAAVGGHRSRLLSGAAR